MMKLKVLYVDRNRGIALISPSAELLDRLEQAEGREILYWDDLEIGIPMINSAPEPPEMLLRAASARIATAVRVYAHFAPNCAAVGKQRALQSALQHAADDLSVLYPTIQTKVTRELDLKTAAFADLLEAACEGDPTGLEKALRAHVVRSCAAADGEIIDWLVGDARARGSARGPAGSDTFDSLLDDLSE